MKSSIRFERWPALLFLGALSYVCGGVLADYGGTWMHPEMTLEYHRSALRNGPAPGFADLALAFDYKAFDTLDWPRARFLSNLVLILNAKFRLYLFQFIPPHPSLSLTWPVSLLSPILLYRLIRRLDQDQDCAWLGVTLYVLSTGFLSGLSLLFHPGKPLTTPYLLLVLLLAARMDQGEADPKARSRLEAALTLTLCGAGLLDETALFAVAAVPIVFPSLLAAPDFRKRLARLVLIPAAAYLFLVSVAAPAAVAGLGFGGFPYWKKNLGPALVKAPPMFALWGALRMLASHFYPLGAGVGPLAGAVAAWLLFLRHEKLDRPTRGLVGRLLAAALLFSAFQAILLARWPAPVRANYYYGAPLSLFLALPFAVILRGIEKPAARALALGYFLLVWPANFRRVNAETIAAHRAVIRRVHPECAALLKGAAPLTRRQTRDFWKYREDAPAAKTLAAGLPVDACWLLKEGYRSVRNQPPQ